MLENGKAYFTNTVRILIYSPTIFFRLFVHTIPANKQVIYYNIEQFYSL